MRYSCERWAAFRDTSEMSGYGALRPYRGQNCHPDLRSSVKLSLVSRSAASLRGPFV